LLGPWLHWIVTEAQTRPEKGVTMVEYMGPAPPAGTHRYIFILFQQSDPDAEVAVPSRERRRWNFPEFLQANRGLVPVAMQYYHCAAN